MSGRDDSSIGDQATGGRRHGRAARGAAAGAAAALVLAGAACPLASGASAQAATPAASWHIVKRVHSGDSGDVSTIVAVGKTGGWAFNGISGPTAWERNGSTWTRVAFPGRSGEEVVAAGASSASNVWAFANRGSTGRALRWNGHRWAAVASFAAPIGGAVVLGPRDVWAFSQPGPQALGTWHFNGRTWTKVRSGHGLDGGSGLSADNIWAFAGTRVAHWNGRTWTRTSVAGLLPAKQELNDPAVVGVAALARNDVYAIGSGNAEDEGGPTVILHYNGRTWSKVAQGSFGAGTSPVQQVSADGHGGLWIPMPGFGGQRSYLLHYSAGHLTRAALPGGAARIDVESVAHVPGTAQVLGGGFRHAAGHPGTGVVAVILQYAR